MILEEIRLKDFRCFFGSSHIKFSKDVDRNITIIYAENGVGKTTLLNALLWCFYGETTARFEKRKAILNYDAKKIGRTEASVEVIFEHDEKRYKASRIFDGRRNAAESFIVSKIVKGSQGGAIEPPETFINTVIPRDMASHFLFDGEHAEVFLGENNRNSIKKSIQAILGCGLVKTSIDDLVYLSGKYKRNIASTLKNVRVSKLEEDRQHFLNIVEIAKDKREKKISRCNVFREQVDDIEKKLRSYAATKELQERRDELTQAIRRLESKRTKISDEIYKWLGENGRFVVSSKISNETFSFLDDQDQKGRIPSPYNEEFVKDILSASECICGTKLDQNSEEWRRVASLLNKAADQTMRDRVTKVRARMTSLRNLRAMAPGQLRALKVQLSEIDSEYDEKEAKLEEVGTKLKGIDVQDISERESRRRELMEKLGSDEREIGTLESEMRRFQIEAAKKEQEIKKIAVQNAEAQRYIERSKLCDSIKNELEARLHEEENKARDFLRNRIADVLNSTSRKTLNLRMTDDYAISLENKDGMALPKSSGENQLLGLAFTAALVEFAKVRKSNKDYYLLPGTIAPLVLDSPFGQLDDSYRKTTAQFVPKMANQVVLLVSKSQGTEDVLSTLSQHIGAEYLLVRHNLAPGVDQKSESRHLNGKRYGITIFDSEFDGTEILEVSGE